MKIVFCLLLALVSCTYYDKNKMINCIEPLAALGDKANLGYVSTGWQIISNCMYNAGLPNFFCGDCDTFCFERNGFNEVFNQFSYNIGDIIVFNRRYNSNQCHWQIYNGYQWVSWAHQKSINPWGDNTLFHVFRHRGY